MSQNQETFILFLLTMLLLKMMFCRIFKATWEWLKLDKTV